MLKAGLIMGGVTLVLVFGASMFSPLCALCVALFTGLGAGYLAGVFDKPVDSPQAIKNGASAGAIAGGMGIIGQAIAAVVNSLVVANNPAVYELFGLPPSDPQTVWMMQLGFACCMGLLNVALMAGLGVAGGAIWFQMTGKKQAEAPLTFEEPAE